jgi:phosphoglycolate phosphatase-like HAD superfamily hydrolase
MKTIIFDFDGTIADSFDFVLDFLTEAAGKELIEDPKKRATYRRFSMLAIARQLGISWFRLPRMLFGGRQAMAARMPQIKPFDGMLEVIQELHKAGFRLMVVSSNSERTIRKFLAQYDIEDYFVRVVGGVGVFGKAPALRRLLKSQRLATSDVMYIGDEVRDIEASTSVGIMAIAVTWGFSNEPFLRKAKPYVVVATPSDLIAVILDAKNL